MILAPFSTEASILSSIKNLFVSADSVSHEENSQTMLLLEPSPMVSLRVKGFVVDENALATLPEEQSIDKHIPLISTYTVRSGDSLSAIAKMFGVSINTILWSNGLTTKDAIQPGQTLVILPVSGISYTVKKGDTLLSIAKKYKADVAEIQSFNGLDINASISVGDILIIPDGELLPVASSIASKPNTTNTGLPGLITGGYTRDPAGYFTHPVTGAIRTRGIHGFNGVDLASKTGTPIYAAAAGKVLISKNGGWNGGYGSYVVISHPNGMQTLYGHLSSVSVIVGETVSQGELIGRMGSTGNSTGPHLHFEVRGGKNPF